MSRFFPDLRIFYSIDFLMEKKLRTKRLLLEPLEVHDAAFIFELVNLPDWIQFIGDRHVHSKADAEAYIQKMKDNPNVNYWVVKLPEESAAIGVITFIKRDFLDHHDIGFAFLPAYRQQGYAYEATAAILKEAKKDPAHAYILATVLRTNVQSVKLLEKLGFRFEKEIKPEGEPLLLYTTATEEQTPGT